ncbi:MSMEG_4193 family putative phosphomutase [Aquipuribacter sp. MA13-6]|uniref:MSMEG_4193 family putative phosphomutase n=1 Tax=unclassified Aquipuribacter TaxID=2635084 RepID=UPI003EEA32D2
MPTVLLLRHGRSTANTAGVLAGRTPGVLLDDVGRAQVEALALRLAPVALSAVVSSPVQRCVDTAEAVRAVHGPRGRLRHRPELVLDDRLSECDYGDWTNRALKDLAKEPHWAVVQQHPSAAQFPGGEALRDVQARAVAAVRDTDARLRAEVGEHAVWVAVTHGDVIKAVVADAVGSHLDTFQRVVADPASVTAIRYTATRPFLLRSNDTGGDLSGFTGTKPRRGRSRTADSSDAVVGGGAGSGTDGRG